METKQVKPPSCVVPPTDCVSGSSSDEEFDIWSVPKPPPPKKSRHAEAPSRVEQTVSTMQQQEKFAVLRQRRTEIQERVELSERRKEARKSKKAAHKELKNAATQKLLSEDIVAAEDRNADSSDVDVSRTKSEKEWKEVQSFLDVNSHLSGPVNHGWCGPKTDLERQVDKALHKGELDRAEELSNQVATRKFASRVHEAFEARKFAQEQMKKKEIQRVKQSKKLHWGFEAKQRWETKGNL